MSNSNSDSDSDSTSAGYRACDRCSRDPDREGISIFRYSGEYVLAIMLAIKNNCPCLTCCDFSAVELFEQDTPKEKRVAACEMLGGYFGRNTRLQLLTMDDCGIDTEEMVALLQGLQNNRSIQHLSFRDSPFGTMGLNILIPFVAHNPNLRVLHLNQFSLRNRESNNFGDEGVRIVCQFLNDRYNCGHPPLESILLLGHGIGTVGVKALAETVIRIGPGLKGMSIDLPENKPSPGWFSAIGGLLSHPRCFLEKIDISDNAVKDEELIILAENLKKNSTLKCLDVTTSEFFATESNAITSIGLKALLNLICNSSSIEETYASNHTITSFGHLYGFEDETKTIYEEVKKYLEMNEQSSNKKSVARAKVFHLYFSGSFNLEPVHEILSTTSSILPNLLEWLARDAHPTLRKSDIAIKKSKRPFCGFEIGYGRCFLGKGCPLNHDYGDLSQGDALSKSLCPLFVDKLCTMGDKCPFLHERIEGQIDVYDKTKLSAIYRILKGTPEAFEGFDKEGGQSTLQKKRKAADLEE